MIANTYALIRVSTEEQSEERQVVRMIELGIAKKNIVIEKENGKSTVRAKYHKLSVQKGIIFKALDTPMLDTDQLSYNYM